MHTLAWCISCVQVPETSRRTSTLLQRRAAAKTPSRDRRAQVIPQHADSPSSGAAVLGEALDHLRLQVVKLHCSVGEFEPDDARLNLLWRRVSASMGRSQRRGSAARAVSGKPAPARVRCSRWLN